MEKWMCIGSLSVAVIFFLLFLADFIVGFPFSNSTPGYDSPFMLVDLGGILSSAIIAYLGWNAYRDVK